MPGLAGRLGPKTPAGIDRGFRLTLSSSSEIGICRRISETTRSAFGLMCSRISDPSTIRSSPRTLGCKDMRPTTWRRTPLGIGGSRSGSPNAITSETWSWSTAATRSAVRTPVPNAIMTALRPTRRATSGKATASDLSSSRSSQLIGTSNWVGRYPIARNHIASGTKVRSPARCPGTSRSGLPSP